MPNKFESIKLIIAQFAQNDGWGDNLPRGLEILGARLFARDEQLQSSILSGDDWKDADLSNYICGNSGDGNFDVILYAPDTDRVIAIQSKYRASKWQPAEVIDEIGKLKDAFTRLESKKYREERLNPKALELVEESEVYKKGKSVSLYWITNQPIGDMIRPKLRCTELSDELERAGFDVEIDVYGSAELLEQMSHFEAADSGRTVSSQNVSFAADSMFEYETRNRRAVVGMLKGNAVSDLYKEQGAALFNLNLRGYLGSKGINRGIIRTAQGEEEAENFFYYNNGITATCSSIENLGKGAFLAHDLQVVNGAQTVKSLYKALKDTPNSKVVVLFRLIETGEANRNKSRFANNIARYQNTQNKILDSDFFANDKIQSWIEANLGKTWSGQGVDHFVYPFHYQAKRSDITDGPGKRITIQELGKLRHAFLHGPRVAYREAKTLWNADSHDRYWEAFGRPDEDGKYVEADEWSPEETAQVAWAIQTWQYLQKEAATLAKERRGKARMADEGVPEENYLRNLAIWVMSAAAVGVRSGIENGRFSDFISIMHSKKTWEDATLPFVRQARLELSKEISRLYEEGQANPRLNLPANETIWKGIRAQMNLMGRIG